MMNNYIGQQGERCKCYGGKMKQGEIKLNDNISNSLIIFHCPQKMTMRTALQLGTPPVYK